MVRKIILASQSKARRKLLRQIGLRFKAVKADVREEHRLTKGPKELVIANALKKAKAAAERFSSGVVIGADTVVLAGGRIIGKPQNLTEAVKTLKLLSRKPQLVYTGLAVIDIENKKVFTGYEETRIYMCRISDQQIRDYFKKVSPLDKAGSFDIQGLGGIFIDRIEGCFYNVVGLPLAKLAKLLKKAGIDVF